MIIDPTNADIGEQTFWTDISSDAVAREFCKLLESHESEIIEQTITNTIDGIKLQNPHILFYLPKIKSLTLKSDCAVLSARTQQYLQISEISNYSSRYYVLIVEEPHLIS
jgi:hypothetical protein